MLVVGIGNAWRGDDATGLIAVERIKAAAPAVRALAWESEPIGLLERWENEDVVVAIDATSSGAAPGTIVHLDATVDPIPAEYARRGTHAIGLAETVELARALGRLPGRLIVYGIEGKSFATGEGLSDEVDEALDLLAATVAGELGMLTEVTPGVHG